MLYFYFVDSIRIIYRLHLTVRVKKKRFMIDLFFILDNKQMSSFTISV